MKAYDEILKEVRTDRMTAAVKTAARLYLSQSIDSVKMTDIADACGLGVASLYRYFGTKQRFTARVAAHIWEQEMALFSDVYDSDSYRSLCGKDQVEALMMVFYRLYQERGDFLRFIASFDAYLLREQISPEDLREYNAAVIATMELMVSAVEKGKADGSIRPDLNVQTFYFTTTHSLMCLCQKLAQGKLLESDSLSTGCDEVLLAVQMFVSYIGQNP